MIFGEDAVTVLAVCVGKRDDDLQERARGMTRWAKTRWPKTRWAKTWAKTPPSFIRTPSGDEIVILQREDYDRLLLASADKDGTSTDGESAEHG